MRGQLKSQEEDERCRSRPLRPAARAGRSSPSTARPERARALWRRTWRASFGFLNIETGAMYRALALKAIEGDLSFDEEAPLLALAETTASRLSRTWMATASGWTGWMSRSAFARRMSPRRPRTSPFTLASAHGWSSSNAPWAPQGGVVMEGRDIGTAVFPDAEVKIFLDAAPEVRGNRRFRQAAPAEADHRCARPSLARHPEPESAEQQRADRAGHRGRDARAGPSRPQPRRIAAASGLGRRPSRLDRDGAWKRFWHGPKRSCAPTCRMPDRPRPSGLRSDSITLRQEGS